MFNLKKLVRCRRIFNEISSLNFLQECDQILKEKDNKFDRMITIFFAIISVLIIAAVLLALFVNVCKYILR